jgi:signal transduction histidine kinase
LIRSRLFQKHFLLAISTLILFLILGFVFNDFLMRSFNPRREMLPPVFIAKIIDRVNPTNKVEALREFTSWHADNHGPNLVLLDALGTVLYPNDADVIFDWNSIVKPSETYGFVILPDLKSDHPKHFSWFGLMGPPRMHPGPGGGAPVLIRLNGEPATYLYIAPPKGPPPGERPGLPPYIGLISMIVSLLMGVGTAIFLIYYSVSKNIRLADTVLSELQNGNLKARFPVHRKDEFGQAMMRFNRMADEIENLVEHLRTVELARTKLLQELAHDLRTPIASLKSLLETLHLKRTQIQASVQEELMALSLKEVEYFERLVEDLLLLAQVSEPKYDARVENVSLRELVTEEAEDCAFRYQQFGKAVSFQGPKMVDDFKIAGDSHLLQRLIRNALENAFSFARGSVEVSIRKLETDRIEITIVDDGSGFSAEALHAYGERRLSRKIERSSDGRLSVGLGSVVMKAICRVHRGEIQVSNRMGTQGEILGAVVKITLPTRSA